MGTWGSRALQTSMEDWQVLLVILVYTLLGRGRSCSDLSLRERCDICSSPILERAGSIILGWHSPFWDISPIYRGTEGGPYESWPVGHWVLWHRIMLTCLLAMWLVDWKGSYHDHVVGGRWPWRTPQVDRRPYILQISLYSDLEQVLTHAELCRSILTKRLDLRYRCIGLQAFISSARHLWVWEALTVGSTEGWGAGTVYWLRSL